uniref:DUF7740 domain-containing protein n=1 Tax=Pseudomonas phage Touem01 TaxID=3138548 RepID=A0AAU6W1S7_9VIRU
MSPFPRTVLGAALDWHAICAVRSAPKRLSYLDGVTAVALAVRIHSDPVKVRCAAWRSFTRITEDDRHVLLLIIESRDPLRLVEMMLEEIDMSAPLQGIEVNPHRQILAKVTALLGMSSSDPLENAVERVQELLDCQARSSALEARIGELTAQIATGQPKASESAVQLGRRLHGEGKSITDLWACATATGADFKQVMVGFGEATAGAA